MATDFAVIMRVRHRFGDARSDLDEVDVDTAAPFAGRAGEFPFSCPNVDPGEEAVLQFEHRGTIQNLTFPDPQPGGGLEGITEEHRVRINGVLLAGGVPAAPSKERMPIWSTRSLLIGPGVLTEQNTFRVETLPNDPTGRNYDNFTIDNAVVFFKTRQASPAQPVPPKPRG